MNADDERLAQLFRLLRRDMDLTQEALSIATGIPVRDIRNLELGYVDGILFGRIRRLLAEVEARAKLSVWWKGAAADRLLDERHASIVDSAARIMARYGWMLPSEVTFSEFGERGSFDLLGLRPDLHAVAVCEIKSVIGSLEETNRRLDVKVRLAPKVCLDRFGWRAERVGRLLIVPEDSTIRRIVAAYSQTMDTLYPARSREVRTWLRKPVRSLSGLWFLSDPRNTRTVLSFGPESAHRAT